MLSRNSFRTHQVNIILIIDMMLECYFFLECHNFDPSTDCVVIAEQRKKKLAIKKKKPPRPVSVSIVMMETFSPVVPKGKERQRLVSSGRIQTMRVARDSNSSEVRDKFFNAFGVSDYTVLECDVNSHGLQKSSEQNVDGDYVSQRRGSLYLCKDFDFEVSFVGMYN